MIRINNLHLPLEQDETALRRKVLKLLRVSESELAGLHLVKQSIDARKKNDLHFVCSVNVQLQDEDAVLRRVRDKSISKLPDYRYEFPTVRRSNAEPPVIVGMGPAGLFAALYLARNGIPSIVLERGAPVEERAADVDRFWRTGALNPASNVQFGEGGAGTFSDGKLTTGTHDARIQTVLETFVAAGAPEDILHSFRPHVGTDVLRQVVCAIRKELIALGCDIRFHTQLVGLQVIQDTLTGVVTECDGQRSTIPTHQLVLAPGHSARDTFALLHDSGIPMERKPFAIGVRIEHRQEDISRAQYGEHFRHLPPSDYRLSCHLPSGRSAFSFCVCPGGQVVASASEPGRLVTNGMSYRARDGVNINGGFLVGVTPEDFGGSDPLAGVRFQQQWEEAAYRTGGGGYIAPVQRVEDFLQRRSSQSGGSVSPTYQPGVKWTDVGLCLPPYVSATLRDSLPLMDRKVHGFAAPDAVLTGIETRSSSPVKIPRGENGQCAVAGIYPCGEGCGYAGGIMSAAVDGVRIAEAVASL